MQHYFINSDSLMDPFYFEEKKNNYLQLASREKSVRKLLYGLSELLEELITQSSEIIREAYISEILPNFILLLEKYSSYGVAPNKTQKIISIAERLEKYVDQEELQTKLIHSVLRIKSELSGLEKILTGEIEKNTSGSLSFPALEQTPNREEKYGVLEEIEISINSNKKSNKVEFLIVPSLPQLDEKLDAQIQRSWNYAVNYLKSRYKRYKPNLQVTIKFVNNRGIYEGNSLGIVLTIGFIQELFRYYDLREDISYEDDISATGSMSKDGKINEVGNDIIRIKTETVFYSGVEKFIVPQNDYQDANEKLAELLSKYPERKLEIIPAINVKDVITRRDTLKIKHQNIFVWGGGKVLKNKVAVISMTILIGIIIGFYYVNQDNNPYHIEIIDNGYLIKNQLNQVLWQRDYELNLKDINSEFYKSTFKICDINKDGKNEVLFIMPEKNKIGLFNYEGEIIWEYKFSYSDLRKNGNVFEDNYVLHSIIDIYEKHDKQIAVVYAQHQPYYPNPVIKIDLETGKRIEGIFWHSGALRGGFIKDIDNDGNLEIVCSGIHNGLKSAILFSIDVEKLTGQSPSRENYYLDNIKTAEVNHYILLPKPDYFLSASQPYPMTSGGPLFNSKESIITVHIVKNGDYSKNDVAIRVDFDFNLYPKNVVINDGYIFVRDDYINKKLVDLPYSDSKEYRQILMDQIEYWDGEKFAKFSNY